MKHTLILCALLCATALPARAADVIIDLGEVGVLTIEDRIESGVNLLACMRAVLDRYQPPKIDPETGNVIPWTNAQYKAILLDFLAQRGKAKYADAVQAEFNSRLTTPDVRQFIRLEPPL
jgi:hypothetical protein